MAFIKKETSLQDCYTIEPRVFEDSRGFFMETYSEEKFREIGISAKFVQDNLSKSKKGTIRGLHFQIRKPQAKLIQVLSGSMYDVVVDLRKNSITYGKWEGFVLSEQNKRSLFVPRGFAHGFLALEEGTILSYKCDDIYDSGYGGGIAWNDADLMIDWERFGMSEFFLSEQDQRNSSFQYYYDNPIF